MKPNLGYIDDKINDGCASHASLKQGIVTPHQSVMPSWVVVGAGPSPFLTETKNY